MIQAVRAGLASFLVILAGCANVEPREVVEHINKSIGVVSYVGDELHLQKSGPKPFVDHQVGTQQREWGLRKRSEVRLKELLESSGRFTSVRIIPAPVEQGGRIDPDLLKGVDFVLLLQPEERLEYELATKGFGPMKGVGLKQVNRFLEPTKSMAFASFKGVVFSVPDWKLAAIAADTKRHDISGMVLTDGPELNPEVEWMARETVNSQLDAVIQTVIFKLGMSPPLEKR